jgi:hypothetical protein
MLYDIAALQRMYGANYKEALSYQLVSASA